MNSAHHQRQENSPIHSIITLWPEGRERALVARAIHALDEHFALRTKIAREPGVQEIIEQMFTRLSRSFPSISEIRGLSILDIACGSNSSKAPAVVHLDTPFGVLKIGRERREFTPLFEPWFCRIVHELGADVVGLDIGDLDGEPFAHHRVDLGQLGALDFLPAASFDAAQDSRLFGSPEFTAQFPRKAERLKIAREIRKQEQRVLKPSGVLIHSDAAALIG